MRYRKFVADHLFTGTLMLDDGYVLITDKEGCILEVANREDAGEDIEVFTGILTPGFVNCHCHLELSHMKARIPEKTGMVPFLLAVMGSRNIDLAEIFTAIEDAEAAMISRGIVATGDICNTAHTLQQKQKGNMFYHNFIESAGFDENAAEVRFGQAVKLYDGFRPMPGSIVPHAPYSVSENLFKLIDGFDKGSLLTMHNQESGSENDLFRHGTGDFLSLYKALGIDIPDNRFGAGSSVTRCLQQFRPDHSIILVHNVATGEDDLQWISEQEKQHSIAPVYWCLCPNANIYIGDALPDIPLFKQFNGKMVIGTDSLASNHQLDILEELKTLQKHWPALSTTELLQWATVNGAQALRVGDRFGSFEKDKKPGIVVIENIMDINRLEGAVSRRLL